MTDARNLKGKTAVVLGGSSSYGAAAVRALAREGVNLALGGRDRDRLEALEGEVRASGGEVMVVGTHLAKRHHPAHLVEAAVETFGGLDVLLFMARASAPPLESLDVTAWENSVDVNVKGFIYCLAAALPAIRESGGGCVVVVGVEDGGGVQDPLLRASRDAVRTILEGLSREFSSDGIRAAEVIADARRAGNPGECAKMVIRALAEPMRPETRHRTYQV